MSEKEKCFVMMPFTTPEKYNDADHFAKVYEQIFIPAIRKAGYEPYRVDENKICDSIIDKIFEAVRTAPMALCDLSNKNPNVLYELGLRQAYDMPVVLVQDDVTDRIFDVSGISTVTYNSHRLVENVEEAIELIAEAIIQTKEGNESTLVKIVKAKSADFDSIQVTDNDNTNIMLNTILNDIKELKKSNTVVNRPIYFEAPIDPKKKIREETFAVPLKKGVTDKYIMQTVNECIEIFNLRDFKFSKRDGFLRCQVKMFAIPTDSYELIKIYLGERLSNGEEVYDTF